MGVINPGVSQKLPLMDVIKLRNIKSLLRGRELPSAVRPSGAKGGSEQKNY
jgi:hypothetical protein